MEVGVEVLLWELLKEEEVELLCLLQEEAVALSYVEAVEEEEQVLLWMAAGVGELAYAAHF